MNRFINFGGFSMRHGIVTLTAGLGTAALIAACGSASNAPTSTPSGSAPTVAATPTATPTAPPATPTPTAASTAAQVAGTWSGTYSGPFNGTFTLTWNQSGSDVNGRIMLSSPADDLPINGTLSGNAISFGAVGVVEYTGTVSGNSMSGSYVDRANGQTGSWSASKS